MKMLRKGKLLYPQHHALNDADFLEGAGLCCVVEDTILVVLLALHILVTCLS